VLNATEVVSFLTMGAIESVLCAVEAVKQFVPAATEPDKHKNEHY